jgi:hypothetical protein
MMYPWRRTEYAGPTTWPPYSPDLTLLDFIVWGHMKKHIYALSPINTKDLIARFHAAVTTADDGIMRRIYKNTSDAMLSALKSMALAFNIYCKRERYTDVRTNSSNPLSSCTI